VFGAIDIEKVLAALMMDKTKFK